MIIEMQNKVHQVAMYVEDPDQSVKVMHALGRTEWIYDKAQLTGTVYDQDLMNVGIMWFQYDWGTFELEFMRYNGISWHTVEGRTDPEGNPINGPFISHQSLYVQDTKMAEREMADLGFLKVQEFETHDHINKYLIERKERFKEVVFSTRHVFGFDTKVIQRIFD